MGDKELTGDIFMLEKVHRFLQSNNVPPPSNVILDGTRRPTLWARVPPQDADACLFQVWVTCGSVKSDMWLWCQRTSHVGHTKGENLNMC